MTEPGEQDRAAARRGARAAGRLLVTLLLVELAMGFAVFAKRLGEGFRARALATGRSGDAVWRSDDYMRGRILPNQRNVRVGSSVASFNSLGFRGHEPRPAAAYRIVCLGDSVTFGWGASGDQAAYPAVVERSLAAHGVEVINAGMPRFNSANVLDLYVTRIPPLRPRALVVLVGWDDLGYELPQSADERPASTAQILLGAAADGFAAVRVAGAVGRRLAGVQGVESVLRAHESGKDVIHWERFDEFDRILAAMVGLARQNGSLPVLVTLPHFLGPRLTAAEKRTLLPHLLGWPDLSYQGWLKLVTRANGVIRGVAARTAAPLADCERSVDAAHFLDICHLDDAGDRQLAACVVRTLAPVVPPVARPASSR
jgi:hypothetical protein